MKKCAIVLAAGEGTRMKVATAKVLLPVLGKPMVQWVLSAARGAGVEDCCLIVGKDWQQVEQCVGGEAEYALQMERKGTGHAVMQADDFLRRHAGGHCVVLAGDCPLLSQKTLEEAFALHEREHNAVTVISARLSDPYGYGRVIRDLGRAACFALWRKRMQTRSSAGCRKSTPRPTGLRSMRCSKPCPCLTTATPRGSITSPTPLKFCCGEAPGRVFEAIDSDEILGANTQKQLLTLQKVAQAKVLERHLDNGVMITSDDGLVIGPDVVIGRGTVIHAGSRLTGDTRVGEDCLLGPAAVVEDSLLGDGVTVVSSQIEKSVVGAHTRIGPYAHIRPDCVIAEKVKIGNFVEVKNSTVGASTSIAHLTYVGDADVGARCNFGCGVVTTNYDGKRKHRTTVGDNVFIGCNVNLVAPVCLEDGAYIAAGSTITDNVPKSALAIARARQVIKDNWVLTNKEE